MKYAVLAAAAAGLVASPSFAQVVNSGGSADSSEARLNIMGWVPSVCDIGFDNFTTDTNTVVYQVPTSGDARQTIGSSLVASCNGPFSVTAKASNGRLVRVGPNGLQPQYFFNYGFEYSVNGQSKPPIGTGNNLFPTTEQVIFSSDAYEFFENNVHTADISIDINFGSSSATDGPGNAQDRPALAGNYVDTVTFKVAADPNTFQGFTFPTS